MQWEGLVKFGVAKPHPGHLKESLLAMQKVTLKNVKMRNPLVNGIAEL